MRLATGLYSVYCLCIAGGKRHSAAWILGSVHGFGWRLHWANPDVHPSNARTRFSLLNWVISIKVNKNNRKFNMQFGIRNLFLVVAFVAVLCALFVAGRDTYYSQRHQTEAALAMVRGISDIKLHSHIDFTEEVNSSSFTVDGHPDSIVQLGGLSRYADEGQFSISRVGKWTFRVSGRRHLGAYQADTGERVESDYIGSGLVCGPSSPYRELFPFELNTLQDLADHYAELAELFETWPRKAEPGSVTLDDGTTQYYFVVEDGK